MKLLIATLILCFTAATIALVHELREDARARLTVPPTLETNSR